MPDTGIKIAGWNKLSFIDFPGMMSTVLFLAGCNMRCPWCHNPGIVRDEYPQVNIAVVKEYLKKHRDVIEGVVLSGGEPAIHARLPAMVDELRALDLKIKLDTNGLLPEMTERCKPDYLALEIKTIPSRYGELGYGRGDAGARLMQSIEIVKAMGNRAEIRITVVPGFVDGEVLRHFKKSLAGVTKVFLQPFENYVELLDPGFAAITPCSIEQIREFRSILGPAVGECMIRGKG